MTDYELYQLLDANGYEASKENLNILKENADMVKYLLESPIAQKVASDGNIAYFDPDCPNNKPITVHHRTKDGDYTGELDYNGQKIQVLGNVNKKKDLEMAKKLQSGVARGLLPHNWGASSSELIQSNLDNKVYKINKQKDVSVKTVDKDGKEHPEVIKEEDLFLLEQATAIGLEFCNLPINDCIDIYNSLDEAEMHYMDNFVLTEEMGMIIEDMKSKHSVLLEANQEFDFDVLFLESVNDLLSEGNPFTWIKNKAVGAWNATAGARGKVASAAKKGAGFVKKVWNSTPVSGGKEKDYATGKYVGDGFKLTDNRDEAINRTTGGIGRKLGKGAAIGAAIGAGTGILSPISTVAGAGIGAAAGAIAGVGKNIYDKIKKKKDERRQFATVNKNDLVASGKADGTSMDAYIRGKHGHVKDAIKAQKNNIDFQRASKEQQKAILNMTKQQAKREFAQGKRATLDLVKQSRDNAKGKTAAELNAETKTIKNPDGTTRDIKRGDGPQSIEARYQAVKESYIILKKNR